MKDPDRNVADVGRARMSKPFRRRLRRFDRRSQGVSKKYMWRTQIFVAGLKVTRAN